MDLLKVNVKDVKILLSDWTRTMRKKQGLTQDELASALDLSRITIQNLEAGKNVTIDTLLKVLQHFDVLEGFNDFVKTESENSSYKSLY